MIRLADLDAVLFDLDGTLIYTPYEYRQIIVSKVLEDMEIKTCCMEDINMFWYGTDRSGIIKKHFGVKPGLFWESYREHDTVELRKQFVRPYDDVDYIHELRKRGIKTAIVTGAPPNIADMEIEILGRDNFDAVVIASPLNGRQPKPNPECIEECLGILNVKKSKAVYVGNAEEDIMAANNAGLPGILIDRGEFPYDFTKIKPLFIIDSLYKLRY